ncbi:tripartite tricarboxylate transporter substrate binding protein, partial [Ralstonia pseudosolanacearum]
VAGFDRSAWVGVFAPARTPRPLSLRVAAELKQVLVSGDVRATMLAGGYQPEWEAAESFAAAVRRDAVHWQSLIREADLQLEERG